MGVRPGSIFSKCAVSIRALDLPGTVFFRPLRQFRRSSNRCGNGLCTGQTILCPGAGSPRIGAKARFPPIRVLPLELLPLLPEPERDRKAHDYIDSVNEFQ